MEEITSTLFAVHNENTEEIMQKLSDKGICHYGGESKTPFLFAPNGKGEKIYKGLDEINSYIKD